jgi:hypothetical protein
LLEALVLGLLVADVHPSGRLAASARRDTVPRARRDLIGFGPALGRPLKVNDQWLTVVLRVAEHGDGWGVPAQWE